MHELSMPEGGADLNVLLERMKTCTSTRNEQVMQAPKIKGKKCPHILLNATKRKCKYINANVKCKYYIYILYT